MSGITGSECSEMTDSGSRSLKLQTDTPHLVNIGGDRLSTSVTLHPVPQGRVTLGCGPNVDIFVQGFGVLPLHCHIENSEGVVTIYPLGDNLSIDGVQIDKPTRLSQGVMLTIGRSNYMRFNHPAEAKLMKSVLPNPRMSVAALTFEAENDCQPKFSKKPPAVPKKKSKESSDDLLIEETIPSSFLTKVSKFEYLAQQNLKKCISPKVFSSNLVTVNTPARDVLGKSPPDFQNYSKSLPQSALNYSELNSEEKQQAKFFDRPLFGKKTSQYVNVTISDTSSINNKVLLFENNSLTKVQNFDYNNLNNKAPNNKTVNVNIALSALKYNSDNARIATSSSFSNNVDINQHENGVNNDFIDWENLVERSNETELRRTQAQQGRIEEQQIGKAEQARLEEILSMCVEYEKQAQSEKNKLTPNRIKTNGSLPRDRRQCGPLSPIYTTPPCSPRELGISHLEHNNNCSCNNAAIKQTKVRQEASGSYANVELGSEREQTKCCSPYENVFIQQTSSKGQVQSPRTRIKTTVASGRESTSKETFDIIENKFAILENEQNLFQNLIINNEKFVESNKYIESLSNTELSSKFIFPLGETTLVIPRSSNVNSNVAYRGQMDSADDDVNKKQKIERWKKQRKKKLAQISSIKRQIAEIEIHEEELHRDIELEHALISGEHKFKLLNIDKLEIRKNKLFKVAEQIEENMINRQPKQGEDQEKYRKRLEHAQQQCLEIEQKLAETAKSDSHYEELFEEYLKSQEVLDNERKAFEDLEFHHLEEEADWLASREEIQRDILDSSKQIDLLNEQIQELEQQKYNTLKNNNAELNILNKQRLEFTVQLEKLTTCVKQIERELSFYATQESDQEETTDSDSDKSKFLDTQLSNLSLDLSHNMIYSDIQCNSQSSLDHVHNMSQSFNEKLLQEKSVLGPQIGTKYPSQNDIDRISKVTLSAPINIDMEKGSFGRKTIESLRDIARQRHINLCETGSQVIEEERQRVLALKQKVQHEVRRKWAQTRQNSLALKDTEHDNSFERKEERTAGIPKSPPLNESVVLTSEGGESPRPLSETSDGSLEVGSTSQRRLKPINDKHRPLTRYLPISGSDLDLRQHIETAGHQVMLCPYVIINSTSCRGFLHKKGSKLNGWSKRWFVFDRQKHTLTYYNDKNEKKSRGGAYFQAIEEVYLDHMNSVKSPNPHLTFIVKTHERLYHLLAPSAEAMRIWVDVIFTGAQGYQEFKIET